MVPFQRFFYCIGLLQTTALALGFFPLRFAPAGLVLLNLLLFAVAGSAFLLYKRRQPNFFADLGFISRPWQIILMVLQLQLLLNMFFARFYLPKIPSMWAILADFCVLTSVYHLAEFVFVVLYRPWQAEVDSFLIYNNKYYVLAVGLGLVEFLAEFHAAPGLKRTAAAGFRWWRVGLVLAGLFIRWAAFLKLKRNFNHLILNTDPGQQLITTGIYAYERHPSYVGFYFYSIAVQILLGNPVCLLGFASLLWRFFRIRIAREEDVLLKRFGQKYLVYMSGTPSIFDDRKALEDPEPLKRG